MSFVTAQPEMSSTNAGDLTRISPAMRALNAAAARLTIETVGFHARFVTGLSSSGSSYATAAAVNAANGA